RRRPSAPLFPYTTLFRSRCRAGTRAPRRRRRAWRRERPSPPAAPAAAAPTLRRRRRGGHGAEVPQVVAQLGVEGLLEAHRLGRDRVVALAPAVAAARAGRRRLGDEAEGHLAVGVDVVDAHLDLVAELEDVLHPLDPLVAAHLRDVEQAVAAGEDVDERAELRDVDDPARVGLADLRRRRVEDQLDLPAGLLDGGLVRRADRHPADHAVVVDGDVGAGLGGDGVDDLALGPDHLADLLDR